MGGFFCLLRIIIRIKRRIIIRRFVYQGQSDLDSEIIILILRVH